MASASLTPQTITLPVVNRFTEMGLNSLRRSAGNSSGSYKHGTFDDICSRLTRNPSCILSVYDCRVMHGNIFEGDVVSLCRYEQASSDASNSSLEPIVRNFPLLNRINVPLKSLTTS